MATINYGLPTFDGDQADQPIQFKSTITQGFQKIDQVMKQNEEAAAPVSEIETEIENLTNMLSAVSNRLETAIEKFNYAFSLKPWNPSITDLGGLVLLRYDAGTYDGRHYYLNFTARTNTGSGTGSGIGIVSFPNTGTDIPDGYIDVVGVNGCYEGSSIVSSIFTVMVRVSCTNGVVTIQVNQDIAAQAGAIIKIFGQVQISSVLTIPQITASDLQARK